MTVRLAIETSFAVSSIAARRDGRVSERHDEMQRGHAEFVFGQIRSVCRDLGTEPSAISSVVVAVGPGSFTGQRVAVAAAQGIALATGAHAFALNSLQALALSACPSSASPVTIVVDAKRAEVYVQSFASDARPLDEARCLAMAEASTYLRERETLIDGPGAGLFSDVGMLGSRVLTEQQRVLAPRAAALIDAPERLSLDSVSEIRPLYLRAPDAKPAAPVLPV